MDHDSHGKAVAPGSGGGGGEQHGSSNNGSNSCYVNNNNNNVRDLDNAFSRMSLYGGGGGYTNYSNGGGSMSVMNDHNNVVVNGGGGGDQSYNRMLMMRSAMFGNRDYHQSPAAATPFYGSASSVQRPLFNPVVQNGYSSSSSSSSIMDQFARFRSMNEVPYQPVNDHHHLLQSNAALSYPPKQPLPSSVFDPRFARTGNQFDHEHFPQLERFPNGRRNGWRSGSSRMHHHADQLIDEYSNHQSNISFADMRGNLVNYAMDQNGCRILQIMFEKMRREEFDILFDEVIGYITQLMMDQYGNFIFQKLVQVCSVDQRTQIVGAITRDPFLLVNICLNSYGTRAVQKLLMYLTTREQKGMIVAAISPGVFDLSKDGNAHHVIVHCIKNFPYELNKVFLDQMVQYCFELSTDQSGCCVVQSCVDHSRGEGRDLLVREILSVAQLLSEDRFGNYVVQCLLRQMDHVINMRVWEKLKGNFTSLSCNKFGSNVVEACLEQSDRRHVDLIILEMLENPHVSTLFSDPFGNYVTQVALSVSKGSVHEALVREIQKHAPSLQSNQYGKMTLSWFDPKKRRRSMKNRNKYGQFHP